MPSDASKFGVESFFCRAGCSTPSGKHGFTIFSFIEKFEGVDKETAFKRAFEFANVPLGDGHYSKNYKKSTPARRVPEARYSKTDRELFAQKAREDALKEKPTSWNPEQRDERAAMADFEALLNASTPANNAQQAAPKDEVGQTPDLPANNANTAPAARVSPFLTASAGWSQGQIFEATRRVLRNANPDWSEEFLEIEAAQSAALQFEALKHFVKGEPNAHAF